MSKLIGILVVWLLFLFGMPWLFAMAWNYVVPGLFYGPAVTYWQAFCCVFLFGFLRSVVSGVKS